MDYIQKAEEALVFMHRLPAFTMVKNISDISKGELAVLNYLSFDRDGASAGELSEVFHIGTPRIAAILNSLTHKGMASRVSDPEDGRRVLVYVTDAGRAKAEEKRREAIGHLAEFLMLLGEEDTESFLRIGKKIVRLAEEKMESSGCGRV